MTSPDHRLILALDLPGTDAARGMVEKLGESVGFYKIGLGLLTAGGLQLAHELKHRHQKRVFLDLKLFDISTTVREAVKGVTELAPDFLTVHGDPHVVSAAVEGRGSAPTKLLAVTILTSLDRSDLDRSLIAPGRIQELSIRRAEHAFDCGADGVICSPLEAAAIRALPSGAGKLIVTPGTRPQGAGQNDQRRIATPEEAIRNGADHFVIGRPVTQSADPGATVRSILQALP
ncbi:MAG: orotidine-5'-phosphate decarboxylase [Rhodobacteraceae bacterium]|nr:orotidine-5'-phosphate decarboxylase [Paracoccaceae bacterium]